MNLSRSIFFPVMLSLWALCGRGEPAAVDLSSKLEADFALGRATEFLVRQQAEDGRWGGHPGITAIAAIALSRTPTPTESTTAAIAKALPAMRQFATETETRPGTSPATRDTTYIYSCAASLLALTALGDSPADRDAAARLRLFLTDFLRRRLASGALLAGGGVVDMPDISNLHWALDAVLLTGPDQIPDSLKANIQRFIEQCQIVGGDDAGGFAYAPIRPGSDATAWGSLTWAGARTLLLSGVRSDEKAIVNARNWLQAHSSSTENPGLQQGGYYYYLYLATGTNLLMEARTVGPVPNDWRQQTIDSLLSLQKGDGGWRNSNRLWLENHRELCTSYAILSLTLALQ